VQFDSLIQIDFLSQLMLLTHSLLYFDHLWKLQVLQRPCHYHRGYLTPPVKRLVLGQG
jgi:hypothetical protein